MGISFLVTAYNEYEDLKKLLAQLLQVIKSTDELIIQLDNKATIEVIQLVDNFINELKNRFTVSIDEVEIIKEDVVFKVPKKLN